MRSPELWYRYRNAARGEYPVHESAQALHESSTALDFSIASYHESKPSLTLKELQLMRVSNAIDKLAFDIVYWRYPPTGHEVPHARLLKELLTSLRSSIDLNGSLERLFGSGIRPPDAMIASWLQDFTNLVKPMITASLDPIITAVLSVWHMKVYGVGPAMSILLENLFFTGLAPGGALLWLMAIENLALMYNASIEKGENCIGALQRLSHPCGFRGHAAEQRVAAGAQQASNPYFVKAAGYLSVRERWRAKPYEDVANTLLTSIKSMALLASILPLTAPSNLLRKVPLGPFSRDTPHDPHFGGILGTGDHCPITAILKEQSTVIDFWQAYRSCELSGSSATSLDIPFIDACCRRTLSSVYRMIQIGKVAVSKDTTQDARVSALLTELLTDDDMNLHHSMQGVPRLTSVYNDGQQAQDATMRDILRTSFMGELRSFTQHQAPLQAVQQQTDDNQIPIVPGTLPLSVESFSLLSKRMVLLNLLSSMANDHEVSCATWKELMDTSRTYHRSPSLSFLSDVMAHCLAPDWICYVPGFIRMLTDQLQEPQLSATILYDIIESITAVPKPGVQLRCFPSRESALKPNQNPNQRSPSRTFETWMDAVQMIKHNIEDSVNTTFTLLLKEPNGHAEFVEGDNQLSLMVKKVASMSPHSASDHGQLITATSDASNLETPSFTYLHSGTNIILLVLRDKFRSTNGRRPPISVVCGPLLTQIPMAEEPLYSQITEAITLENSSFKQQIEYGNKAHAMVSQFASRLMPCHLVVSYCIDNYHQIHSIHPGIAQGILGILQKWFPLRFEDMREICRLLDREVASEWVRGRRIYFTDQIIDFQGPESDISQLNNCLTTLLDIISIESVQIAGQSYLPYLLELLLTTSITAKMLIDKIYRPTQSTPSKMGVLKCTYHNMIKLMISVMSLIWQMKKRCHQKCHRVDIEQVSVQFIKCLRSHHHHIVHLALVDLLQARFIELDAQSLPRYIHLFTGRHQINEYSDFSADGVLTVEDARRDTSLLKYSDIASNMTELLDLIGRFDPVVRCREEKDIMRNSLLAIMDGSREVRPPPPPPPPVTCEIYDDVISTNNPLYSSCLNQNQLLSKLADDTVAALLMLNLDQ